MSQQKNYQTKWQTWSEIGPYGSVGAYIKTGRSPVAQNHFQTPPDPKRGYKRPKNLKKSKRVCATSAKKLWELGMGVEMLALTITEK